MTTQQKVLTIVRKWIGTPYRHQGNQCGVGTDCLGLIVGVYTELYGKKPKYPNNYTPWWAEETKQEVMLESAREYLWEIPLHEAIPGDVLLFRFRQRSPVKHAAIKYTDTTMVHAYSNHSVMETPIYNTRRIKPAFAFRFPDEARV